MAHPPDIYAHALYRALKSEANDAGRARTQERFRAVLKRRGAEHLLPAVLTSLEKIARRDQESESVRVQSAGDAPELVAGVEVYKGDTLVDNTLRSRLKRLVKATQ